MHELLQKKPDMQKEALLEKKQNLRTSPTKNSSTPKPDSNVTTWLKN